MKFKMKKYIVHVPQHPDISDRRMAEYIRDAVNCWSGQLSPDDPLFENFWKQRATVKRIK